MALTEQQARRVCEALPSVNAGRCYGCDETFTCICGGCVTIDEDGDAWHVECHGHYTAEVAQRAAEEESR